MLRVQTCLSTKQLVAGCEKLLQKVESSSISCNKIWKGCAFYRPKANLFCIKWRNSRVYRDPLVLLFTQRAREVWTWVVKHATSLLNSFYRNVAKQVVRFRCPFDRRFCRKKQKYFYDHVQYSITLHISINWSAQLNCSRILTMTLCVLTCRGFLQKYLSFLASCCGVEYRYSAKNKANCILYVSILLKNSKDETL